MCLAISNTGKEDNHIFFIVDQTNIPILSEQTSK